MSEEMMLKKLEKSREAAAKGEYKPADMFVAEMREKYGL